MTSRMEARPRSFDAFEYTVKVLNIASKVGGYRSIDIRRFTAVSLDALRSGATAALVNNS